MASQSDISRGTPSFVLRKLVTREIEKAKSGTGDLQYHTFIEHPITPNTQILGPAFFDLPLDFTPCYPILEKSDLVKDRPHDFSNWAKKNFVCWPNYDREWEDWSERMLKLKKKDLEDIGLLHVISLLLIGINQNPSLIHAALSFWDPSYNCFRFNCGMMAPTVLDVSFLVGLPPFGLSYDITQPKEVPFLEEMEYAGKHASYNQFLNTERKYSDEVSDREFFAYIWYTLCKMIFCHGGKKMMLEFAPLAYTLSNGEIIDLASYFLGYVYKIGSDNHAKPFALSLGGPLWFLQLWLLAYFPDHQVAERSPLNVYGEKYLILASTPLSLIEYLQYFHQMKEEKDDRDFLPFNNWDIGPSWISRLMHRRGQSTYRDAWVSILLPKEIIFGAYIGGCRQAYAETYCPAQFARQLGFEQAIPCPYPGEINADLSMRGKVDKNQLARVNVEYRRARMQFHSYEFTITSSAHPKFSQWWHNTMALYNSSTTVKAFAREIGVISEEEVQSGSISDDGFGTSPKSTSQGTHEERISEVQSSTMLSVALNVKPLRSIPHMVTRSQQQATTSPSGKP